MVAHIDTEKNCSICELKLLAVVWGLEKFRFCLRKESTPVHRSPSIKTFDKT